MFICTVMLALVIGGSKNVLNHPQYVKYTENTPVIAALQSVAYGGGIGCQGNTAGLTVAADFRS